MKTDTTAKTHDRWCQAEADWVARVQADPEIQAESDRCDREWDEAVSHPLRPGETQTLYDIRPQVEQHRRAAYERHAVTHLLDKIVLMRVADPPSARPSQRAPRAKPVHRRGSRRGAARGSPDDPDLPPLNRERRPSGAHRPLLAKVLRTYEDAERQQLGRIAEMVEGGQ